jgi:hypothetical protein
MKEIKNWEAKVLVEGEEKIALPLPGCIILGELDGEPVRKTAQDIDMTKLMMIAQEDGHRYRLEGTRQDYVTLLNTYIEFSKTKEVKKETVHLETMQKEQEERQ